MRLADYVVSYSLQINNRCLRYLAECDVRNGDSPTADGGDELHTEGHMVFAESLLSRDSRRLASMWSLMKPSWEDISPAVAAHVDTLKIAATGLAEGASGRRLALRLASVAGEDDEAQAIVTVARKLPAEKPFSWDVLNELFAQDSHFWRQSTDFRQIQDEIVCKRVVRSYRKSFKLANEIFADEVNLLASRGGDLSRWVQLCAHQLELLRPGLSDKGKSQLWYLDKMSDTLRTRSGLVKLHGETRRVQVNKEVSKDTSKIVLAHIDRQIGKMDKRVLRLASDCFNVKPKRMAGWVEQAALDLGLRDVSLMQANTGGPDHDKPSGGDGTTTGNVYV